MIKTIKKIDLQGNEVWQEVIVCNRCKQTLEPEDMVYEIKWTSWHPVKMSVGTAFGFGQGCNPVKHICQKCYGKVERFLEGEEIEKKNTPALTTLEERVAAHKTTLKNETTAALLELRNSFMCSVSTGIAIDEILKERQL